MSKRSLEQSFRNQLNNTINNDGRPVKIVFHSSVPCTYCTVDPTTGESISFYCSTCNGTGKYEVSTSYNVSGVVNTFINNTGFVLFGNELYNIIPEGKARATFWINDVLINTHSPTGSTYFDSADGVFIDGREYVVQDYQRVGYDKLSVVVVNLSRVGKE